MTAATAERRSVAESLTLEILRLIDERETLPWMQDWVCDGIWPQNPVTGTVYRGVNPMILGMYASIRGYTSPYWVTFKQMVAKGASFNQPAKGMGVQVVYWNRVLKADKDDPEGKVKAFGFWKVYTVFNTDLIDGLTLPEKEERVPITIDDALLRLQKGYDGGPEIRHVSQDRAFYRPSTHTITLPLVEQFTSSMGYGETISHELCHSTGHDTLLKRNLNGWSCQQDYAKEELVAEIGAVMVMQMLGLDVDLPRAANYVQGWRKAIADDPQLILSAGSKAHRAAEMVLGVVHEKEES